VEHYWPGLTTEIFRATAERVRRTAEAMARDGTPIRYWHSTMVPADEAAYSVIDAVSQDLVKELYARSAIRFARITAFLEGEGIPSLNLLPPLRCAAERTGTTGFLSWDVHSTRRAMRSWRKVSRRSSRIS
jgi:hypothetical protein